jgi:GTPase SAR1 family protein
VFYSVDSRHSFDNIGYWKQLTDENKVSDSVPVVIVGNKSDLVGQRVVQPAEGERRARALGCHFIETSALTGDGVHDAFELLARLILSARRMAVGEVTQPVSVDVVITEENRSTGCCRK